MALIVVMVSGTYTYPQTHHSVYIKHIQVFICPAHLNKVVLKNQVVKSDYLCDQNQALLTQLDFLHYGYLSLKSYL